jgi:serine/threonine protein kinase
VENITNTRQTKKVDVIHSTTNPTSGKKIVENNISNVHKTETVAVVQSTTSPVNGNNFVENITNTRQTKKVDVIHSTTNPTSGKKIVENITTEQQTNKLNIVQTTTSPTGEKTIAGKKSVAKKQQTKVNGVQMEYDFPIFESIEQLLGRQTIEDSFPFIDDVSKHYRFCKKLGAGSFGVVFKAIDLLDGTNFAVKVINKSKIPIKKKAFNERKLMIEYNLMRRLDHDHIIKCFGAFSDQENYYILMDLVDDGSDLLDFVLDDAQLSIDDDEKLTIDDKKDMICQIIAAVEYYHSQQIAHRDLKPENIMVVKKNGKYILKIIDFGLANLVNLRKKHKTMCGSPIYMAPEIATQELYNPQIADIWSLGAVMFVILTASFPWKKNRPIREFLNYEKDFNETLLERNGAGECAKMFQRIFVAAEHRITISELKKDPWFKGHLIDSGIPKIELDVMNNMTDDVDIIFRLYDLGFSPDSVAALIDNEYGDNSSEAAMYQRVLTMKKRMN